MVSAEPVNGVPAIGNARRAMYRRQVLAAAEYEFSRAGFDEAKMTSIAKTAEVSLATVYKHFAGKAEVWDAVHADRMHELLAFVATRTSVSNSPLDRLLDGVASVAVFLAEHPVYLALNLREGFGWGASDVEDLAAGTQRTAWTDGLNMITLGVVEAVKAGQLPALRPRIASGMIISALQVWLYDWSHAGQDRTPDEVATEMTNYLRRMLTGRED